MAATSPSWQNPRLSSRITELDGIRGLAILLVKFETWSSMLETSAGGMNLGLQVEIFCRKSQLGAPSQNLRRIVSNSIRIVRLYRTETMYSVNSVRLPRDFKAAKLLKLNRTTFYRLAKRHGLGGPTET